MNADRNLQSASSLAALGLSPQGEEDAKPGFVER